MNTKSIIKNYISNNVSKVLSVVCFTVLTIIFKLLNPIFMKLIIDYSLKSPNFADNAHLVVLFTILMGLSTVLSLIFDSVRQSKSVGFGSDITLELRSTSFQVLMKAELYELNKVSNEDLSSSIVDATHKIGDEYIYSKLIRIIYHATYLVAMLITMFVFNSTFGTVSLLSLPILYFITKYLGKLAEKRTKLYVDVKDNHEYVINDHIEQLKTIKIRNGISKETELYDKVLKNNKKVQNKSLYVNNLNNSLITSIFTAITWFIIFLTTSLQLINTSDYNTLLGSLGSVIGCIAISPKIIGEFKKMLDIYFVNMNVDDEIASLDKIYSMRAEARSENIPSLEEVHSLKFNSVCFDYINYGFTGKVNLDNVEFEVKKGEKLGIIGLPGSGKTTIADLITKVIRPKQGNVLINNCDINKLNTYYLRDIVTYIPENFKLLDASIEENIIYPLSLDEYKYNDSLNKCKLKDLIFSLPNRDSTNARQANLTPSDIQKISLANAFYKESSIIVLDDATSKLDTITEDDIMNEFFKLKNKISIVISNRINTIVKCDKVLIINNGKVSEYGRVDELLAQKNSSFARMVKDAHLERKVV